LVVFPLVFTVGKYHQISGVHARIARPRREEMDPARKTRSIEDRVQSRSAARIFAAIAEMANVRWQNRVRTINRVQPSTPNGEAIWRLLIGRFIFQHTGRVPLVSGRTDCFGALVPALQTLSFPGADSGF